MRITATSKKYMIIAVSVQIWKFTARNNFGTARQESAPQSATTYISERYHQCNKSRTTKLRNTYYEPI
jgi:hypothetical protein